MVRYFDGVEWCSDSESDIEDDSIHFEHARIPAPTAPAPDVLNPPVLPDYDAYKRELTSAQEKYAHATSALRECFNIRSFRKLKQALNYTEGNSQKIVCARDYPVGDEINRRMKYKKEYLVGLPTVFFRYGQVVNKLLLDEVLLLKKPTPIHFDIEIKMKTELDSCFIENAKCILQNHASSLGLEHNVSKIETCAEAYCTLVVKPWEEDECIAGLRILCSHIKKVITSILPDRVSEENDEHTDYMSILLRCRSGKFSFHILLKHIFCESNLLSMPLIVFQISRTFVVKNTTIVLSSDDLESPDSRF